MRPKDADRMANSVDLLYVNLSNKCLKYGQSWLFSWFYLSLATIFVTSYWADWKVEPQRIKCTTPLLLLQRDQNQGLIHVVLIEILRHTWNSVVVLSTNCYEKGNITSVPKLNGCGWRLELCPSVLLAWVVPDYSFAIFPTSFDQFAGLITRFCHKLIRQWICNVYIPQECRSTGP